MTVSSLAGALKACGTKTVERRDGFDLKAARARLASYRSLLSSLSADDRAAVLSYDGPEIAGDIGARRR